MSVAGQQETRMVGLKNLYNESNFSLAVEYADTAQDKAGLAALKYMLDIDRLNGCLKHAVTALTTDEVIIA